MWRRLVSIIRGWDGPLFTFTILLLAVGLAELYSSSLSRPEIVPLFNRQLVGAGLGLVGLLTASLIDFRIYRSWSRLIYIFSVLLLLAVLVVGSTVRGTTGWFIFGWFRFQPIELVKFLWVIVLASYLSHAGPPLTWKKTLGAIILAVPLMILILLQPDFGSGFLLLVCLAVMLAAIPKIKRWWIWSFVIVLSIALVGSLFLKDYQIGRIKSLVNPQADRLGQGYNVTQSIIAVGAGHFFGRGLGLGTQSQLKFLPEQHTDFIFASIAEELGLFGSLLIIILWGGWFYRIIRLMARLSDDFALLISIGILSIFAAQVTFNIGMNIGLMPVVGITLPFVSYGGSSLIVSLTVVGILLNLSRQFGSRAPQDEIPGVDRGGYKMID